MINNNLKQQNSNASLKITGDRRRTNILKKPEQRLLAFLVQHIPLWISSDMLTVIGLVGSMITASSFVLALYVHRGWLLLGILGFAVNWFGDSLDGRVAYFRNKPRKWYGKAKPVLFFHRLARAVQTVPPTLGRVPSTLRTPMDNLG
jgi:hypothetical protein